jgi:flagellar hook assembly protein FlgD
MRRWIPCVLALVLALAAASARGDDYELEVGKVTRVMLRIVNHNPLAVKNLRLHVHHYADWLDVVFPQGVNPTVDKVKRTAELSIKEIKANGTIEIPIRFKLDKKAPIGGLSVLFFKLWKNDENPGQGEAKKKKAPDDLGAAGWRSWEMDYSVRVATAEVARKPTDMAWHIVDARRGSTKNEVNITITNGSKNTTLTNMKVFAFSMKGLTKTGKATSGKEMAVRRVDGLNIIEAGNTGTFSVPFSVSKKAKKGDTDTVQVIVQCSTLGAHPNPWNPVILVNVAPPDNGLPGNFEAHLLYNLPPGKGDKATFDPDAWLPVPKGTKVTVAQVYKLRGAGGAEKFVEQFIGYGNVIDDTGYVRCRISPVNEPVLRLRIVVDTIANVIELKYKAGEKEIIESFRRKQARAAVTPFGKRTWRNISHTFRAKREREASIIRTRTDKDGKVTKKEKVHMVRVLAGQERSFVAGRDLGIKRILIPYYGYERDLDGKRDKGILIKWEGELSTGGHINHFSGNAMPLTSYISGQHQINDQELVIQSNMPGLYYHNHNELLHVLNALVRAQEYLSRLDYFDPKTKILRGKDDKPWVPKRLPGVIAYWRKGARIKGGETGYALRDDGTWRLVIQHTPEDPDERDVGLVLRGFGAAVRRKFFKPIDDDEAEQKKPLYEYYKRTTLEKAWQQGFDIFFAACVLDSPKVLNQFATQAKDRRNRSVDLQKILDEARQATGDKIYAPKYRRIRGADNPVAVAAGLWRASQEFPRARFLSRFLWAEGGSVAGLLKFIGNNKPDLLKDMAALGLCPWVERWPPASAGNDGVSPQAVKIIWHPNDVLKKGKAKAWIVLRSGPKGKAVKLALKGKGGDKGAIAYDFGKVRNHAEGEAQLGIDWVNGQRCYWTVETKFGKNYEFTWPDQEFVATLPSVDTSKGRRIVNLSRPGTADGNSMDAEQDSADGSIYGSTDSISSILGGRDVLGGAVYRVGLEPGAKFLKPVKLRLGWRKGKGPGDATPGIYRLNTTTDRWDLVGKKRDGDRHVIAMINKPGSYALMVDRRPPGFADTFSAPNPFPTELENVKWTLRTSLSEPAVATVQIENAAGKLVKMLMKDANRPAGELTATWDGTDTAGARVKDGVYTWKLLARDESKRVAKPVTGAITVYNGVSGSVKGKVTQTRPGDERPRVEVVGKSLAVSCDDDGSFWLIGLPPGEHMLRVSASGHFEETRKIEIKDQGGEVALPTVALSHLALKDLRSSSEVFTPNGDGDRDYLSLKFAMTRACPLDVSVYDANGEPVSALQQKKPMPVGDAVALWQGRDDEKTDQPSGWYTVQLTAHSRTERILQGELKVLLDRGLVQNAHAFPYTFSPNGDGFDDELELGYNLDNNGSVSIRLLRKDGSVLKELAKDKKQEPGWITIKWDGRGKDGEIVPDGKYDFEIRPKYPTGHASIVVKKEFMADSKPPEVTDARPVNGSTIKTGMPVVSAKIISSLDDIDPSQLKIKIDENTVPADSFDRKTGVFSFTPKTSLGEGLHIAIAYAQDWAGNYAPPQAVSFKVQLGTKDKKFFDKTKPEILSLTPAKNSTVYTPTPLIVAKVRDVDSGIDEKNVIIHINGERVSNAVRSFIPGKSGKPWDWYSYEKAIVLYDPLQGEVRYVPVEPMKEGKNHVTLEMMDRSGNKSKKAECIFTVVIDKQLPKISKLRPVDNATLARPEVVVTARLADVGKSGLAENTLRMTVDGDEIDLTKMKMAFDVKTGSLRVPLPKPLRRDAQHSVQLTVRDRAGNLSHPAVTVFNIVEDGEMPRVDALSPRRRSVHRRGATILFAAAVYDLGRSGVDPASVELAVDGKRIPKDNLRTTQVEGYLLSQGLLSYRLRNLKAGRHVVTLKLTDRAGNPAKDVAWPFEVK